MGVTNGEYPVAKHTFIAAAVVTRINQQGVVPRFLLFDCVADEAKIGVGLVDHSEILSLVGVVVVPSWYWLVPVALVCESAVRILQWCVYIVYAHCYSPTIPPKSVHFFY